MEAGGAIGGVRGLGSEVKRVRHVEAPLAAGITAAIIAGVAGRGFAASHRPVATAPQTRPTNRNVLIESTVNQLFCN